MTYAGGEGRRFISDAARGGGATDGQRRRLRRGKAARQLNLRGMRLHEAQELLESWIPQAVEEEHRVVEIVHGKGTGKLRSMVEALLGERGGRVGRYVSAMERVQDTSGGSGVLRVRLKRSAR